MQQNVVMLHNISNNSESWSPAGNHKVGINKIGE
jgi:hypothetical protein